MLQQVLEYAARGWHVLPCRGKVPYTSHGVKDATIDKELIKEWWSQWPEANVAIATGTISGIDVLDVDSPFGLLYETRNVQTPKGRHYYFKAKDQGCAVRFRPDMDIRANGGYVIAPPSPRYQLIDDIPLQDWPADLVPIKVAEPFGAGLFEGEGRDIALYKYCCWMRGQGLEWNDALARAHTRNATFVPPFPEPIVIQKMEQAWKRPAPASESNDLEVINLATYEPKDMPWLIKPWLPKGEIVGLEGLPGLGKTALIFSWIAKLKVPALLWSKEDSPGMLAKRAKTAEADASLIHALPEKPILPLSVEKLKRLMTKYQAKLLVLDPFISCLGNLDLKDEQEARRALEPLRDVCHELEATTILVRHWNRVTEAEFCQRGKGGDTPLAIGRLTNAIIKGPESEHVLAIIKQNCDLEPEDLRPRMLTWDGKISQPGMVTPYTLDELEEWTRFGGQRTNRQKAEVMGISERTYRRHKAADKTSNSGGQFGEN